MESKFLTTEDVADLLHVTPQAILRQRDRGQKPGTLGFRAGKRLLFHRSDIEEWLDERRAEAPAAATPEVSSWRRPLCGRRRTR